MVFWAKNQLAWWFERCLINVMVGLILQNIINVTSRQIGKFFLSVFSYNRPNLRGLRPKKKKDNPSKRGKNDQLATGGPVIFWPLLLEVPTLLTGCSSIVRGDFPDLEIGKSWNGSFVIPAVVLACNFHVYVLLIVGTVESNSFFFLPGLLKLFRRMESPVVILGTLNGTKFLVSAVVYIVCVCVK